MFRKRKSPIIWKVKVDGHPVLFSYINPKRFPGPITCWADPIDIYEYLFSELELDHFILNDGECTTRIWNSSREEMRFLMCFDGFKYLEIILPSDFDIKAAEEEIALFNFYRVTS